jgi:tetratricopeptide (TPR) repeat protein
MNFSRRSFLLVLLFLLHVFGGCRRSISPEEHKVRGELREALHSHAFERAIPLARQLLHFVPRDNGTWARLAQAQAGLRDRTGLRETLAAWQKAVKRPSEKFYEFRGDLALADGQRGEALAAWTKSIARKDRKARVFEKIARLEQEEAHWSNAAANWSNALKLRETPRARIKRAICFRHLHQWDAALADLHQAEALAPDDQLVRREAVVFERLGKFLAEVRELDKELAALPNDFGLLADRALLFLRAKDAELALDDANRAGQLAPGAVRPKLFGALAQLALGRESGLKTLAVRRPLQLEALSPEFLQTISRLDADLALEPTNADLRVRRAWQLNEIGQPQLALADAEQALASNPKSAGACAESSYALAKLNRALEAYGQIKRATELDPNFSTAWQYRGELEMRQNDYLAAIDSLSRALAINQTVATLEKREECYRKLGLLAKADDDHKALEQIRTTH